MKIVEIVKKVGQYYVTASLPSGLAHDGPFKTFTEARIFVMRFYGLHV